MMCPNHSQHYKNNSFENQETSLSSLFNAPYLKSSYEIFQKTANEQQPRYVVTHNYHDRSNEKEDKLLSALKTQRKPKGGVAVPFPEKLHQLLDEIESDEISSIISWQPHGRCFLVHKPKEFVSEILPNYFNQSKIGSFQRQLNLYGFRRLSRGRDKNAYYHEYFLRGRPHLVKKINRMRIKGNFVRGSSNPETEPNFYSMTWVKKVSHVVDDKNCFDQSLLCHLNQSSDYNVNQSSDSSCSQSYSDCDSSQSSDYDLSHSSDCDSFILSFEGKKFHYIDHLDIFPLQYLNELEASQQNSNKILEASNIGNQKIMMESYLDNALERLVLQQFKL